MPAPAALRLTAAMSLVLLVQPAAMADRLWLDNPCCGYDGRGPQGYRPAPNPYPAYPHRADPYRPHGYQGSPYPQYQPAPAPAYPYPANPYPPNPGRPHHDRYPGDPAYSDRPYNQRPVVVVPPVIVAPMQPSATYGRSPAEFVYWCDAPKGYYPNVTTCDGPWREKSATSTR